MSSISVTSTIFSVGVQNPDLKVFDIVMATKFGTSYNSFLIRGEKTALIETCHLDKFEEYLQNISEVCAPSEIDYIILNHTEPDHSGALADLFNLCPNAEIYCSQAASIYLKSITNRTDLPFHVCRDGDILDLGGLTLQFFNAPFLHWPDTMFTYCAEEKVLFSCDFFGSHYSFPPMWDNKLPSDADFEEALLNYYVAIFSPFKPYVIKGLNKIEGLTIDTVCTSHGPILTKAGKFPFVVEKYKEWSVPNNHDGLLIPIFYCSAYGNTEKLAGAIAEGILSVHANATVEHYNIIDHPMEKLASLLAESDAFLLGSPTLNRDAVPPVWQLLSHVDAINIQKRPCALFGSYGWSGEAVPALRSRLTCLKTALFEEDLKVCFVPSADDLAAAKEFGKRFAMTLNL